MKNLFLFIAVMIVLVATSCKNSGNKEQAKQEGDSTFKFLAEQFADLKIIRYQVPGFDSLTLNQKKLVYYLSEAALCGRDIVFDQNFKHNLTIRRTLEQIYKNYKGDRNSADYGNFEVYFKRVLFSSGIHHHYSTEKFLPEFSKEYFAELVKNSEGAKFPLMKDETPEGLVARLTPILFDPNVAFKRLSQDSDKDLITNSACNFYEGVNQAEAEAFYAKMKDPNDASPVSYGLNSKLVKENGKIVEKVYKVGGLYDAALVKVVYWLEQAAAVAENEKQKVTILKLVDYYKTGDLNIFDEYSVNWVSDVDSHIDFVNGFIEVYGDPLGLKATWESVVNFKDLNATKRAETISANAQWFEDRSPVDPQFRKKEVKGVSAKVITVAQLGGDCYPSTPIGINLPNADWIRKEHGSKSVTMENITYAYDQAAIGNGFMEEFCFSPEEIELDKKYGSLSDNLHTDLHECLGHASGQVLPNANPDNLKNYYSPLEESRADLFALYFLMDPKLVELGIMPSLDVAKIGYMNYIRNGLLTQLTRIEEGKNIEQAHMRCRKLIAEWCYEKGKAENVIEMVKKDGKTYVKVNDFEKLRKLFGELLAIVQKIKSTGDYKTGKELVETYGIKVDPVLHKEVKERFVKLNIAPYGGFINPLLTPVMKDGEIVDVKIEYPDNYLEQMMYYSEKYSFLPDNN